MKKSILLLLVFTVFVTGVRSQGTDNARIWKNKQLETYKKNQIPLDRANSWDLSPLISNQGVGGPFSTYVGVFGPQYRRIDFRLHAEKERNTLGSGNRYQIVGKNRLGRNIRDLKGVMTLTNLFRIKYESDNTFIGIFNYQLAEPGDRDGDGVFEGVFSLVFFERDGKVEQLWAECGDFRELNNMFVGKWKRFNGKVERECIFTFSPLGLYNRLPFCDDFYNDDTEKDYNVDEDNPDISTVNPAYMGNGWGDHDAQLPYPYKSTWWKTK